MSHFNETKLTLALAIELKRRAILIDNCLRAIVSFLAIVHLSLGIEGEICRSILICGTWLGCLPLRQPFHTTTGRLTNQHQSC